MKQLTLGEVAAVESLAGISITEFGDDTKPKGKALAAMAFVAKKRSNPEFTFEQALELSMDEANVLMEEIFGSDTEEDPKETQD